MTLFSTIFITLDTFLLSLLGFLIDEIPRYALKKEEGQKQSSRGVPRKRCSENMQQIYWRTPMQKSDFNKVAKQLYWNHTSPWVLSCKFAAYFQNTFSNEHLWVAASGKIIHEVSNWENSYIGITKLAYKRRFGGR